MIAEIIGRKMDQTQAFLKDGTRVPVSRIRVSGNIIIQIKTVEKESYNAIQVGFQEKNKAKKSLRNHFKKAGIEKQPRFLGEIRLETQPDNLAAGSLVGAADVLKPGDIVDVSGISKGKGYAGVVKRHHFKGGPRTHGQSDRERAPGSIGQTTTPGRVYKGKRMAGKMGNNGVTIKNLEVLDIVSDVLYLKGLVPGSRGSIVRIKKMKESKKFIPLFKLASQNEVGTKIEEEKMS